MLADIRRSSEQRGLEVAGVLQPAEPVLDRFRAIVLLGPSPSFWPIFRDSPEGRDLQPDPMDRWSRRVVSGLAELHGAVPLFPFDGPPFLPFTKWALATGRCWISPVGLLVHDRTGLMVSFRGALGLAGVVDEHDSPGETGPPIGKNPCSSCPGRPCMTACPVGALTGEGYDVAGCKQFLRSVKGRDCMTRGCNVRRACPVSRGAGRSAAQSAFHMRAFL